MAPGANQGKRTTRPRGPGRNVRRADVTQNSRRKIADRSGCGRLNAVTTQSPPNHVQSHRHLAPQHERRRRQDDRHRQSRRLPRPQSRQARAPRRPRSADQRLPFPHSRTSLVRVGGGTRHDSGHLRSRRRRKTRQARQSPQVQGVHRPQRCPPISLASISSQATSPSPSSTSTWRRGRDANASSAAAWTKSGTTTT